LAIDELIEALEREAAARVEGILADGRERAARLEAQHAEEHAQRRAESLSAEEARYRKAAESALASARQHAVERVLRARAALLDRVFATAEASLREAEQSARYREGLTRRLDEALRYLTGRDAIVRCRPELAKAMRPIVGRFDGVRVSVDRDAAPGFAIDAADGSLSIDETLPARLERMRPSLAIEILQRLGAPEACPTGRT